MSSQSSMPGAPNGTNRGRRFATAGLALLVAAAGVFLAARWWAEARSHVSTDDAFIETTMVQVAPKVGGRISQVLAATGARVEPNQVLARLETDDLEANVRKAEAAAAARWKDVAQAEAALSYETKQTASRNAGAQAAVEGSDLRVQQAVTAASLEEVRAANELRQARAGLAAAQADRTRAEADLTRAERLFSEGAVSAQQRDAATNAAAEARSRVEAAEAAVALAEADTDQIAIKQKDVEASRAAAREAEAALAQARAAHLQVTLRQAQKESALAQATEADQNLHLARIALQNAEVRSPSAGVISQKLVEPGEMVAVGQPLFTLARDTGKDSVWVTANLKETQIGSVRVNQPVEFSVDAYPGVVFHGHVADVRAGTQAQFSLIPAQQPSGSFTKVTQRIPVKISIDSSDGHRLVSGMSAVVKIDTGRQPPVRPAIAAEEALPPAGALASSSGSM